MYQLSVTAGTNQTHNVVFNVPEIQVVEASQVERSPNNTVRLKFMSRRAYQNPAVKNKDKYKTGEKGIHATNIDERKAKASKRLNRQFRSKRPYINYQLD